MVSPMSLTEKIKPIMPLRHGHLAQLLACGMMNGVVFDKDGGNPLVVNTKRPAQPATCHNHFNGMLISLKKVSALSGDNFQSVIICGGTIINRHRLIGGIISL